MSEVLTESDRRRLTAEPSAIDGSVLVNGGTEHQAEMSPNARRSSSAALPSKCR
jgi:hypothetical protein